MATKRIRDLTTTATSYDLLSRCYGVLDTPGITKKLPGNLLGGLPTENLDLNTTSLWTNSQIDPTNGSVSTSDSRLSTPNSLALASNTIFDYTKGANVTSLSIYVYAYEDDGTFIAGLISVENFPTWIQSHPEAKQFKLSMIPTGSVAVIPSNLDNIVTFNADVYVYNVATRKYVDNRCDSLKEAIEDIEAGDLKVVVDLNSSVKWRDGGLNTSTGDSESSSSKMHTVDLYLTDDSVISFTMKSGYSLQTWNAMCYKMDGTYLGYVNAANITGGAVSVIKTQYPLTDKIKIEVRLSSGTASTSNVTNILSFATTLYENPYATKEYVDAAIAASSGGGGGGGSPTENLDLNTTSLWARLTVDGDNGGAYDPGSNGKRLATKDLLELDPTSEFDFTFVSGVSVLGSTVYFYPYQSDGTFIKVGSGLHKTSALADFVSSNPTAKKFRLAIISIDGATVSGDNLANIVHFNKDVQIVSDYASKAYVDSSVAAINTSLSSRIDDVNDRITKSYDLSDTDMWLDYGVDTNTGGLITSEGRISTNMLELLDNAVVNASNVGSATSTKNIYFYAADKSYLGCEVGFTNNKSFSELKTLYNKPTAKFVRFGLLSVGNVTPISAANIANIVSFAMTLWTDKFVTEEQVKEIIATGGGASGNSILAGKKWVALGDSFTEGVSDTFDGGPYDGQNKAYPQYVGVRNPNLTVVNYAKSGSTIAYKEGTSTSSNCFTYPSTGRLYSIPQDADIITLKFGINDEHESIPLGTISDTTNATEYGAWNLVLEYLVTNFPLAKIGVIVTNGCSGTTYPQAAKDCAKKWGIPVLDENFDYNVPLLHRVSGKPDVASAAHQLRLENFRVSSSNTHPNAAAMEFESTFVEEFLMRL